MSTTTKHRQTPTQRLHAEIARLAAELEKYVGHEPTVAEEWAYLREENQRLEEIRSTATEHKFLIDGHEAGEHAYFVARRDGLSDCWGVFDETLGSHRFWAREHCWYRTNSAPRVVVYPWSEANARRIARMLAGVPPLPDEALDVGYLQQQIEPQSEPVAVSA